MNMILRNNLEKNVKNRIKQELENLEYNFSYIGTEYLIEAIYLLYSLKFTYNFSLEKDVYPAIANRYGDSSNNIKSAIVYATDKMFYDCDEKKLKKYLCQYNISKPGPKTIIRAIIRKIK